VLNPVEEEDPIVSDNPTAVALRQRTRTSHHYNLTDDETDVIRRMLATGIRKQTISIDKLRAHVGPGYKPGAADKRLEEMRQLYFKLGGSLARLNGERS
jgi:hypothetical protein